MDKWWLGTTHSSKCYEEVISCGIFTWDFCAGRESGKEIFLWSSSIAQSSIGFMNVNDRQWCIGVQLNPKPSDCDGANYRGIYAKISAAIARMIRLCCFCAHSFPSLFCIIYHSCNCVLCCFSPDMLNPTTQSSLDVFLLFQRVPRETSREGRCIWLWKMSWCQLQRK